MNRKPLTEVEIIDECDEFLDSFSNQKTINIDRLQNSLIQASSGIAKTEKYEERIKEILKMVGELKSNKRIKEASYYKDIIPLKETLLYGIFETFLESSDFLEEIDDESYVFDIFEVSKLFENFFDETYLTFNKKEDNLLVNIVTTNLAKRLQEMVDKNKVIVLMSGTIHSEKVLKEIFGLDNFEIIEAETKQQGKIEVQKTGLEMDCRYGNFSSGVFTRERYIKVLSKCISIAKPPVLVHINSFKDLPTEEELRKYKIDNIMSKEKLMRMQKDDNTGEMVKSFKEGKINILFSTRCARGIDFPGEQCNSIIFTKYPNPNVEDAFWKILKKTNPNQYWDFYKDKAKRELLQKVYRGLRSKDDHVYLLSPDSRVLDVFKKN